MDLRTATPYLDDRIMAPSAQLPRLSGLAAGLMFHSSRNGGTRPCAVFITHQQVTPHTDIKLDTP